MAASARGRDGRGDPDQLGNERGSDERLTTRTGDGAKSTGWWLARQNPR